MKIGSAAMFTRAVTYAGHVRRFSIQAAGEAGWEFREEEDSHVVRRTRLMDWHRVEREMDAIAGEVAKLQERGWICLA
jgi:hypothetical protein